MAKMENPVTATAKTNPAVDNISRQVALLSKTTLLFIKKAF